MAGFDSINPLGLLNFGSGLASNVLNQPPLPEPPPPFDADPFVQDIQQQADRDRRRVALDDEQRAAERARDLRTAQASARADAAARGVSGGGSARAMQRSMIDRAGDTAGFEQRRSALDLGDIEGRRRRNLLSVEEERRRAQMGLQQQLQQRRTGFLDLLPF